MTKQEKKQEITGTKRISGSFQKGNNHREELWKDC